MSVFIVCCSAVFTDDVEVHFDGEKTSLENIEYGTSPLVAHGNGASKVCSPVYLSCYLFTACQKVAG